MSRITKEIANEVARKLTTKKTEEIQKLDLLIQETLELFILKRVPKDVIEFQKTNPKFTYSTSSFRLIGNGFNHKYLNTKNDIPYNGNNIFEPKPDEAKKLLEMINKKSDLKSNLNKLFSEIENLLYNLRTYNKVIIEFPEVEPFLPKTISNKLMVNVNDIRQQLK